MKPRVDKNSRQGTGCAGEREAGRATERAEEGLELSESLESVWLVFDCCQDLNNIYLQNGAHLAHSLTVLTPKNPDQPLPSLPYPQQFTSQTDLLK